MSQNQIVTTEEPFQKPLYLDHEEEISLIDIWLVLVRHKGLILAITAIFAAIGVGIALTKTKSYGYTAMIEIGSRVVGNQITPIESPETAVAKLEKIYIPQIIKESSKADEQGDEGGKANINIDVQIPKGSQLILLSTTAAPDMENVYGDAFRKVVARLHDDHNRVSEVIRQDINNQIGKLQRNIEDLTDQSRFAEAKITRLSEEEKVNLKEIEELKREIAESERKKSSALDDSRDAAKGLMMLVIMGDLQKQRERLSALERETKGNLADERDALKKILMDNERQKHDNAVQIDSLKMQLANFQETRMLAPLARSLKPVGTPRRVIVLLAVIIGILVGVFSAFVAEFLRKVRERSKEASIGRGIVTDS